MNYSFNSRLPNLDLFLYSGSGFVVRTLLESSVSSVDDVELVYRTVSLPARYALAVAGDTIGTPNGRPGSPPCPSP